MKKSSVIKNIITLVICFLFLVESIYGLRAFFNRYYDGFYLFTLFSCLYVPFFYTSIRVLVGIFNNKNTTFFASATDKRFYIPYLSFLGILSIVIRVLGIKIKSYILFNLIMTFVFAGITILLVLMVNSRKYMNNYKTNRLFDITFVDIYYLNGVDIFTNSTKLELDIELLDNESNESLGKATSVILVEGKNVNFVLALKQVNNETFIFLPYLKDYIKLFLFDMNLYKDFDRANNQRA